MMSMQYSSHMAPNKQALKEVIVGLTNSGTQIRNLNYHDERNIHSLNAMYLSQMAQYRQSSNNGPPNQFLPAFDNAIPFRSAKM